MFALARVVRLLGLFALFAIAFAARAADMLYFNDGRILIGEIIKETDDEVEAKGTIDGVAMHSTFKRSQIASVIKDAKKKPTSIVKTDPKDEESKGDFLIVPLKGEFGTDIYPLGVINAMDWCVKNKVPQIVFVIDSPGGYVWAAQYMAEKMAEKDASLKFTMVIDSAISASIWPAFASDRWYVTPAATFGGAVVYHVTNTGSAEVDTKMNSILAAKVGAMAESNGHSAALARAMMLPGASAFAVQKDGRWIITDEGRPGTDGVVSLNKNGIITLTAQECLRYGLAGQIPDSSSASIAAALGENKRSAGDGGEAFMRNAKISSEGLVRRWDQFRENYDKRLAELRETARKTKDLETVLRRVDALVATITNAIGPIRDDAKRLHYLPLIQELEGINIKKYTDQIYEIKKDARK
ncbi:MAG: hypothetical protein K2Y21_11995 [Phycisphaerales bacterium]|nr:hypothetical protein [Phycisphaerales bacterium]